MNRFGGVKGGLTLSKHVIRPSLHPGEDEISIHGGKILVQQHGVLLQIGFVTWNLGEKSWIRSGEIDDFGRKWMCLVKTNMFCRWLPRTLDIPGCFWFECPSTRQGYSNVKWNLGLCACRTLMCHRDNRFLKIDPIANSSHFSERLWTWKIRSSSHPPTEAFSWVAYFKQCRIFLPLWSNEPVFCQQWRAPTTSKSGSG